ncbi:MAG: transposase [Roseateles asaccharophilus]|uniref:Transposase n=1 Tax=Roseateles asaccharophilus TaxID=582607 RepID=A0A4R6NB72_9BURK|nr:transposase [Roseateles asaccharophilus]
MNLRGAPRREYTLDFKREALARAAQCGVYAAARELGLAEQTLRNWAQAQRRGTLERAAEVSVERMELSRLRAENARRRMRLPSSRPLQTAPTEAGVVPTPKRTLAHDNKHP